MAEAKKIRMAGELSAHLADTLFAIQRYDGERPNYPMRNMLVHKAVAQAIATGYAAGFRIDRAEPEWPVAYIELPTGQVSWHTPQHPVEYDGHTTTEKYTRLDRFVLSVGAEPRDVVLGGPVSEETMSVLAQADTAVKVWKRDE